MELRPSPDGSVRIHLPASISIAEEQHWVGHLLRNYNRKRLRPPVDIAARARALAREYGLPLPHTVKWSDTQNTRWGSCTPSTATIRISSALSTFPMWVIDYVLIHELAHLRHARHDAMFWHVVSRYQLTERARGFLIAKGLEDSDLDEPVDVAYASSGSS